MSFVLKNGEVYLNGKIQKKDCLIDDLGRLVVADDIDLPDVDEVLDCSSTLIVPGLIDPHVHLREPGYEYKGNMASETRAMAKGGFTTVFSMPNLKPVPDSKENMKVQLDAIEHNALIRVIPYGAITKGEKGIELSEMEELSEVTIAFSDDGKGVQAEEMMRAAMKKAAELNCIIVAHCEDESELKEGGCIHDGHKAQEMGLVGINSESEWKQIERDIRLAEETGCQYHICHISTKEGVELVRQAKKRGVNVSAEVTVHHLLMCEDDIKADDGRYKMNPPLRTKEDQEALIAGLNDGTIEMICTDHAPHSEEEKSRGLAKSLMGITSSEYAFSLVYSGLVKTGKVKLETVLDAMSYNCANIFGIEGGDLTNFEKANLTMFDLMHREKITEKGLLTKGKSTPFIGWYAHGVCLLTVCDGQIVYRRDI